MPKSIEEKHSNRMIFILLGLLCIIPSLQGSATQQALQLTQDEFKQKLIEAYNQNSNQFADSLIRNNRLLVKPFTDGIIKESLTKELKGKTKESKQIQTIAIKTAETFEKIFGEKSLTIAVKYLSIWTKEQKRRKLVADSLDALVTNIRGNEQDREKAIVYYQQALDLYKGIGDERGEGVMLGGLGLIHFYSQDYGKALSFYKDALKARVKVDDKQIIGNSLNMIGAIYLNYLPDYEQALHFLDSAEIVRTEIGDQVNLGRTIPAKASAYDKLNMTEQALQYFKKSLVINQKVGDQTRVAEALHHSGTILNSTGKYSEALENLEKALVIYQELDLKPNICEVLTLTGFVYTNLGDYNTAVEKLGEALKISKETDDKNGVAGALNNLGIVLQNAGRLEKAKEYFDNSIKIYEELGDQPNLIAILSNLGTVYFDLKDYSKAADYHKRGLELSCKIMDKDSEAHCFLNLANDLLLLGRLDESMSNYEKGLELARSLDSPELTWKIIAGMAESHEMKGEFEKSLELNDTALKILEGMRNSLQSNEQKASFMASERYVFEDIINSLADLHLKYPDKGYDLRSFRYAEESKARVFLDLLAESVANVKEGVNNDLVKEQNKILVSLAKAKQSLEQELKAEQTDQKKISELKGKIKVTEDDLSNIKREIRKTNPKYADLHYPQSVSLEEVTVLCPDKNTVILEYSVGDSASCLWAITRSAHHLFKLPGIKVLHEQIESFRFALLNPDQSNNEFLTRGGYSLYQQLLQPAEPYLTKKSKLVIIPDGILNYLPFEVLLTDNKVIGTRTSFSGLPYLVKKYPVSYGQSASVLKSLLSEQKGMRESGSDNKKLIAFGDPIYESANDTIRSSARNYKRLEYSGKEVENIASFFKKGNAYIYLRDDATEENVKREGELKKFNYIHFATHGFIDETKPDFSSLVLTKGTNSSEDGLLQAEEIFNLNLKADLVVLSACQTGLGKMVRGEGMIGLTRAFLYAGTPSVLVSLWSVSDVSTATLMGEFYRNLIKEKLSKTDALRKAQLSIMRNEKFAHPFHWASFVLIGDWR